MNVSSVCFSSSYTSMHVCSYLEAEGLERTFKFKQEDIAAAVPLASSLQVCYIMFSMTSLLHDHHSMCFILYCITN